MTARFPILCCSIGFGITETGYFGWNFTPQSPEELICDGIALLLMCLALAVPRGAHNG